MVATVSSFRAFALRQIGLHDDVVLHALKQSENSPDSLRKNPTPTSAAVLRCLCAGRGGLTSHPSDEVARCAHTSRSLDGERTTFLLQEPRWHSRAEPSARSLRIRLWPRSTSCGQSFSTRDAKIATSRATRRCNTTKALSMRSTSCAA